MTKIERKTHVIDAASLPLGRLATEISDLLRGKRKPGFAPNVDNGDFVTLTNLTNLKVTGKKYTDKIYYSHSGYKGSLKALTMKQVFEKDPTEVVKKAVYNMLPKNKLRAQFIKRLKFEQ